MHVDRQRVARELTFWLRPGFFLRCLARWATIEGIDRSIALASSAFTALIPLSILVGVVLPWVGEEDTAQRLIDRLDLSGAGADAVRTAFAPPEGTQTSLGIAGFLLAIITVLAFSRAVQRLIERTWELPSRSVRNTRSGLVWILGLAAFSGIAGVIAALFGGAVFGLVGVAIALVEGVAFLAWSGVMLSAHRVTWQRLLPFAVLGSVAIGIYGAVSDLWLPDLFDTYTQRYGVIGATFALISWLFGAMILVVAAAAIGREITDEVEAIRAGEREDEDAVLAEWRDFRTQAEQVRAMVRERWAAWRSDGDAEDEGGA